MFSLLFCSLAATAQDKLATTAEHPEAKSYVAPISCTASVPTTVCKQSNSMFSMLQMASRSLSQVEFVIADPDAFQKENERLNAHFQNTLTAASKDEGRFLAVVNRHPTAPSSLGDSVLFVLSDEGVRTVNRVVISTDLFRKIKSHEKPTTD